MLLNLLRLEGRGNFILIEVAVFIIKMLRRTNVGMQQLKHSSTDILL